MKPEQNSQRLLGITRAKAKMYEYDVPNDAHINIYRDPANLFPLAIGLLGDLAAQVNAEETDDGKESELREGLEFAAQFFDSYLLTNLNKDLDPYLLLLGSSSYYLRDLPGSSLVLSGRLGQVPDLETMGLETLLLWLLKSDYSVPLVEFNGPYASYMATISNSLSRFFGFGNGRETLLTAAELLRRLAYQIGTARQLLFADVIGAVVKKRLANSTWDSLPEYSGLELKLWQPTLEKSTFVRELWPSQRLLGKYGVFKGNSAIVQMPTSAGKTKAFEIIIRSAFLSGRAKLAVVVAPYRALCREIRNNLFEGFRGEGVNVNELTDVFQVDFEVNGFLQQQNILIVTPEKLLYVLRQFPNLAKSIGLLIYDEGHQFDSGRRGIIYELLLTSLKTLIPAETQTLLVSAVISNANEIGNWLIGDKVQIIPGANLLPTYRTVAFASWLDTLGRLEFVVPSNPDEEEFYVPRVIEQQELLLRRRETKARVFPDKEQTGSVALYLGIKTVSKGGVAVFCGNKLTVSSLCDDIADKFERGLTLAKPSEFSDKEEVKRLQFLYEGNLGVNAPTTKSASLGIFAHHGNVPHGIRLAVEYAMREGLAKFVICTSTLAQGVNLPIRYLIVAGIYQGADRITVRDFQNLVGRAGRSGMYTEGSIVFASPDIFDNKGAKNDSWQWQQVRQLLQAQNPEPCISKLSSVFEPITYNGGASYVVMEPFDFVTEYLNNSLPTFINKILADYVRSGLTLEVLIRQVQEKLDIITAVESYLMAHWDETGVAMEEKDVIALAQNTLAYFLISGDPEHQTQIVDLFRLLAQNIDRQIIGVSKRKAFGKSLYGVQSFVEVEEWIKQHLHELVAADSVDDLLERLWPVISKHLPNRVFRNIVPQESLLPLAHSWIKGISLASLFQELVRLNVKVGTGERPRHIQIDNVVEICETALAFESTLLLSAIIEIVRLEDGLDTPELILRILTLQKRLRYGLLNSSAIFLYEMGFADRVVATELSLIIGTDLENRQFVELSIRQKENDIRVALDKYPRYFEKVLKEIL